MPHTSSLYPADSDDGSTYSQSPGRPTLYSDPSAPSLGRPVGNVRQSFETAASSTTGGGGGVVGSPFADPHFQQQQEGSSSSGGGGHAGGASLRPRKAHTNNAGGSSPAGGPGPRESIFNSVYNNSGSRFAPPPLVPSFASRARDALAAGLPSS